MMYLTRLSGFEKSREREVRFFVFTRYCCNADDGRQGRNCHMVIIHASVGKDQDIGSVSVCTVCLNKETVYGFLKTGILIINNRNGFYLKSVYFILRIFIRSVLVRIGLLIRSTLQFSGFSSKRFPADPIYTVVEVTTSSRMESIGGLVTCANSCLK